MTESAELCVVGAGITGLNALFVASRYLAADQRVILIDRRDRVGGMWVDTYPYVRLHQPHPMFTAGNIGWTLGRDPSYLAAKIEVLAHFQHCLDEIRQRVIVDERYGWELESEEETGDSVRITCRDRQGRQHDIEARRLIKAYGFNISPNPALEFSSTRVHSVSPDSCDMRCGAIHDSDAPVWIVGSGKTAMDTALALITSSPGREVNLIAGSGTFFSKRDSLFPNGARRWLGGLPVSAVGSEVARRFDGTNEQAVADWYRSTSGTGPTPQAGSFVLGVLSEGENRTIAAGLNDIVMDHLVDVVDQPGSTDLVLRSGATKTVEPGSWLVNCTGYLPRTGMPYEPYASGNVLSIQTRSATMHLSSFMGYFMTHLLFLDKLRDVPLYELDIQELLNRSKAALPYVLFTLAQYNTGLIADAVPGKVFGECGLDFDRWYPRHRRTAGAVRFMLTHKREREHLRETLDTVADRFDIRCGPLPV